MFLDKFKAQCLFWLHGPSWFVGETLQCPTSELGCLSADRRMLVLNNAVVISPVGFASTAMVELESFYRSKFISQVTFIESRAVIVLN